MTGRWNAPESIDKAFHTLLNADPAAAEPGSRLHQDYSGLRPLLRRDVGLRFRGVPGHPYEQGFDLRLIPAKLSEPLKWKTPKMVFVNSMSDVFHKDVPDEYVQSVVGVMQTANWHTYQVLTKRYERLWNML